MKCESCNGTGRIYKNEGDHVKGVECPVCVGGIGSPEWKKNLKRKQKGMRRKLREEGLIE